MTIGLYSDQFVNSTMCDDATH